MRVGARSHTSLSVKTAISAAPVWVVIRFARGASGATRGCPQGSARQRQRPSERPVAPHGRDMTLRPAQALRANYSTRIVVDELKLPDETTRPMMLIA
jgi:hypothetical protein